MFKRNDKTYSLDKKILDNILNDKSNPLTRILDLIPNGSRVLDVGAGNGILARLLKKVHKNVIIDGIEPNPYAAKLAKRHYQNFYNCYFQDAANKVRGKKYDFIVLADVIEHLADPLEFIKEVRQVMSKNTKILISVPNVAFGAIRLDLLNGNFKYVDSGIIEKTHLRFFTIETIKELVAASGLHAEKYIFLQRNFLKYAVKKGDILRNLYVIRKIGKDKMSSVYQILIVLGGKQTKVSICIPTFNQTRYLKKTLDSILIQTYRNYEIIITDDSSNNNVKKLIDRYNFKGRLKYFKNKTTLGSPENWNESIRHAAGEYIKILHHDDWFTKKDSLKKFVDLLDNNPKTDFAFSATMSLHTITKKRIRALRKNSEILLLGNIIGAPSATIYKRNLNLKYDKNLKWFVDIDFYVKVLAKNNHFAYSPEPLINVTADAAHQVTKRCLNKEVELFESIYLYNKIKSRRVRIKYFLYLVHLINKYQILSVNDIPKKDKLTIPSEVKTIIRLNKLLKLF